MVIQLHIFLDIIASYGRKMDAVVCGLFGGLAAEFEILVMSMGFDGSPNC